MALASAVESAQGQTGGQEDPLAALRRRLAAPKAGSYSFEMTRVSRPVNETDARHVRAYVVQAVEQCWKGGLADENPSLAKDNAEMIVEHGGTALSGSVAPPPDGHLRGVFTLDGDQASSESECNPAPGRLVRENFYWSAKERLWWRALDELRAPTSRLGPPEPAQPFPPGVICDVYYFEKRALLLIDLASSVDSSIHVRGNGNVEGSVSLDSWKSRDAFRHPLNPGHGVRELPGDATFSYDATSERSPTLVVRWHDCLGGLLVEERMTWSSRDEFPRELARRYLAPGLDLNVQVESTWFSPVADDEHLPPLEWIPRPGEVIVDERFGRAVKYTAGPTGTIPADEVIQAEAMSGPEVPSAPSPELRSVKSEWSSDAPPVQPRGHRAWLWAGAILATLLCIWWVARK